MMMTTDPRITWVRGDERPGPRQLIGVLEVRGDGAARAALAERTEVDGRCHILLAREAWGSKDALQTRWYSLVLDPELKAFSVRNGSCGDRLTTADVPQVCRALESLGLVGDHTMLHVDDGPSVLPGRGWPTAL
jgi:hypothetical protein